MATNADDSNDEHKLWLPENESFFIGLLYEEAKKGLQTTTLDRKTWQKVEEELFKKFAKRYKIDKLKSKFNRLRIAHREFSQLLQNTGMGWDPQTRTVTASEEVWESYLKVNPGAKKFRKKGLPHYDLLGVIFNNTTATGQMNYSSTHCPPDDETERQQEREFLGKGIHVDVEEIEDESTDDPPTL
ncbi:Myb/SANT-like domain containing protein [Trema orientale]|uniref:Myb/SANT-like domain containing protein n=1 Tax=Trema orientale TaxID=63057 RepID=A0A2P5EQD3_TREOI|nr:Myb/SANT-like domain containing protein [Trema orientale]